MNIGLAVISIIIAPILLRIGISYIKKGAQHKPFGIGLVVLSLIPYSYFIYTVYLVVTMNS